MLRPIKNKLQYERVLTRIYNLLQKEDKRSSKESDELEVLSILAEAYEEKNFPILPPDPIEAIKLKMEELGLKRTELGVILGQKSRATEVLNRKRKLTLPMIRALNRELKIPAEVLIAGK